uniref:Uncharacterized protein n=1 Tax=Aegilops tauschii subsp. strangulata TaxID=200361 RepID=A0A453JGK6_AEGTS
MESRYKHGKYPFRSYIPRYLTTPKGCQRLHTPDYHMNQPNTAIIFTQRYAININRVVGQQSHIHANVWRLLPPQGSLFEISLSKPCSPLFCSTIHDYSNEQRINITLVPATKTPLHRTQKFSSCLVGWEFLTLLHSESRESSTDFWLHAT